MSTCATARSGSTPTTPTSTSASPPPPLDAPGEWTTAIAGSDEFYLNGFSLFEKFLVTEGRLGGLDQVELRDYATLEPKPVAFPEASYVAGLGNNPEYAVDTLRLSYQSMVTPGSVYDYHTGSGELELLKQQEIPSGYDADLYTTERLHIRARDGTMIPVSVMARKDRPAGGPLHLYAYGAYGYAYPPGFSITRLSLVDRGMAFAIAHIRGGDDLGRDWYLSGKRYERWNTFNDFVDAAKGLVESGHTAKGKISISGGSAGGQLMGVVANTDPELWGAVVADVPFVDCLNTMLDESLPLTPGEWPEWGDPLRSKQAFAYILSYSPYDQVSAQPYPPMLVTGGLNDPRVTYWEPAKWVARLRELKTDERAAAQDQHGRGARRQVGPLRIDPRSGRTIRLRVVAAWHRRVSNRFAQTFTAQPRTSTSSATSTTRCGSAGCRRSRRPTGGRRRTRRMSMPSSGS